jgi:hypothetical protein
LESHVNGVESTIGRLVTKLMRAKSLGEQIRQLEQLPGYVQPFYKFQVLEFISLNWGAIANTDRLKPQFIYNKQETKFTH